MQPRRPRRRSDGHAVCTVLASAQPPDEAKVSGWASPSASTLYGISIAGTVPNSASRGGTRPVSGLGTIATIEPRAPLGRGF